MSATAAARPPARVRFKRSQNREAAADATVFVLRVANLALARHGLHLRMWFEPDGDEAYLTAEVRRV